MNICESPVKNPLLHSVLLTNLQGLLRIPGHRLRPQLIGGESLVSDCRWRATEPLDPLAPLLTLDSHTLVPRPLHPFPTENRGSQQTSCPLSWLDASILDLLPLLNVHFLTPGPAHHGPSPHSMEWDPRSQRAPSKIRSAPPWNPALAAR